MIESFMELFDAALPTILNIATVIFMIFVISWLFLFKSSRKNLKKATENVKVSLELQEKAFEAIQETNKKLEIIVFEVREMNRKMK